MNRNIENENIHLLSCNGTDLNENAWGIIDVLLVVCRFQGVVLRLSAVHLVRVQKSMVLKIKISIWNTTSSVSWDVGPLLVTTRLKRMSMRSGVGHYEGNKEWRKGRNTVKEPGHIDLSFAQSCLQYWTGKQLAGEVTV